MEDWEMDLAQDMELDMDEDLMIGWGEPDEDDITEVPMYAPTADERQEIEDYDSELEPDFIIDED